MLMKNVESVFCAFFGFAGSVFHSSTARCVCV